MNNNYMTYNQPTSYQPFQATQYFLQPQGNLYMLGSLNEVANVPVGAGLSAAICLKENTIYLKTIQNGNPMLLGYKLCPLENNFSQEYNQQTLQNPAQSNLINDSTVPQNSNLNQNQNFEQRILGLLESFEARLLKLENSKDKGGAAKWPL